MSKTTKFLALGISIFIVSNGAAAAEELATLRGTQPLDAASLSPQIQRLQQDHKPDAREYIHQPPLIPHDIKSYTINLKFNKCLTCHSWANYRNAGATKISSTHFSDRDGAMLANVSGQRYFCTQCHVPQAEAEPLVENTFSPIEAIKER
ncbi:nitrate reductase cytochrome c-type subunit [Pseudomonadota bacterium]